MKISFAICTHNEADYVVDLLNRLVDWLLRSNANHDPNEYEIVVVDDYSSCERTLKCLSYFNDNIGYVSVYKHALNNDFAAHKNFLNSKCTGDWILNVDADEWIPESLLDILPLIVESNPLIEAYYLPRINTVEGLTLQHVQKWGWVITTLEGFRQAKQIEQSSEEYKLLKLYGLIISEENGFVTYNQPIVCWPDTQMRFFQNTDSIRWKGKVHEQLTGFEHFSILPQTTEYAIRHHKEIDRQEKQNALYETLTN